MHCPTTSQVVELVTGRITEENNRFIDFFKSLKLMWPCSFTIKSPFSKEKKISHTILYWFATSKPRCIKDKQWTIFISHWYEINPDLQIKDLLFFNIFWALKKMHPKICLVSLPSAPLELPASSSSSSSCFFILVLFQSVSYFYNHQNYYLQLTFPNFYLLPSTHLFFSKSQLLLPV